MIVSGEAADNTSPNKLVDVNLKRKCFTRGGGGEEEKGPGVNYKPSRSLESM